MKPNEAAFEEYVATWLVEHGGYNEVNGGLPGAQTKFVVRLASEIDRLGTVDVVRHVLVDHGVTIRLAYFKPAHGLTPELMELPSDFSLASASTPRRRGMLHGPANSGWPRTA